MMGSQRTPARHFCLDEHVPSDHMLRGIDHDVDHADQTIHSRRLDKGSGSKLGERLDRWD